MKTKNKAAGSTAPEKTAVHFSVSGEFITRQAREFWQECQFTKAINLLKCANGISQEQIEDVLFGRLRLTGINDITLVPDDWKMPEGYCPSMMEVLHRAEEYPRLIKHENHEMERLARRAAVLINSGFMDEDETHEFNSIKDCLMKMRGWQSALALIDRELNELRDASKTEPLTSGKTIINAFKKGFEILGHKKPDKKSPDLTKEDMYRHHQKIRMELAGFDVSVMPSPEEIMDRGMSKVPKKCSDMSSPSGWLLPTGEFYGCGCMEHIGLATNLLKDSYPDGDGRIMGFEGIAEGLGWVKISKHLTGTSVICMKRVTRKQVGALKRYAAFHKKSFASLVFSLEGIRPEDLEEGQS